MLQSKDIYDPKFVEDLFDKMSESYERVNYITSFGFSQRWRRQCVEAIQCGPDSTIVDLLSGMGECWPPIIKHEGRKTKLIGLDFSSEMTRRASKRRSKYPDTDIIILKEDVFNNSIDDEVADGIISGFGLKTFNPQQLQALAQEIKRILKPGGYFSLVDVSVPNNGILRFFYMFYLKHIIPILGWSFLGNPETYRMLGVFTERFKNAKEVSRIFETVGLEVEYVEYFFGCASGVRGRKSSK